VAAVAAKEVREPSQEGRQLRPVDLRALVAARLALAARRMEDIEQHEWRLSAAQQAAEDVRVAAGHSYMEALPMAAAHVDALVDGRVRMLHPIIAAQDAKFVSHR
jgi:hypothetical protein